jgi:diaminopimelate epimerase
MQLKFSKYHGTGNDFVLIDDRDNRFPDSNQLLIAQICHRHFGVGADGLMLLRNAPGYDFEMVYFNSDGARGSMCGNGGRCISRFANDVGVITEPKINFIASDGPHVAFITNTHIQLKMSDVHTSERIGTDYFLDTGSPHVVRFTPDVATLNVVNAGREIRYNTRFAEHGTNVNFVEVLGNNLFVRTYERGVENETLSCGTGVTAAALAAALEGYAPASGAIAVETPGGSLNVHYHRRNGGFDEIWLEGPAKFVFQGEVTI